MFPSICVVGSGNWGKNHINTINLSMNNCNNNELYRNNVLEHENFNFKIEILDLYINCRPERRSYRS